MRSRSSNRDDFISPREVLNLWPLDIVGWRTSSIRRTSELPEWEDCVDEKYPHVVYEEHCKACDVPCESPKEYDGLDELEEELLNGLSRLSWEKVDVSFHSSRLRFAAHSVIQLNEADPSTHLRWRCRGRSCLLGEARGYGHPKKCFQDRQEV